MEASRPLIQQSPTETAIDMINEMRALAEIGDWEQLEHVAVMLRSSIMAVPESERAAIVIAAQQVAAEVNGMAEQARRDVASRLRSLRRGRNAARAYGDNTGHVRMPTEIHANP
jgi:hypothetical protein